MQTFVMLALLLCVAALLGTSTAPPGPTKTITVDGLGQFTGNIRPGCNEYLGIKFANAGRFEDPTDISPWPATYDATSRGPMCYQSCPEIPEQVCQQEGIDEDCLFLNIFTPTGDPTGRCVIVFYHGGNYRSYSGASLLYDGEEFVNTGGCILVTVNYRLSVFGFLGARNSGIKDQIKALKWIHTHIEGFGGDNSQITLFGQSAGAQSVLLLMSIPEAAGYFNKVILQSTPVTLPFRDITLGAIQETVIADQIGCEVNDLKCYKAVSASEILKLQDLPQLVPPEYGFLFKFEVWGPVIDGKLVLGNLYDIIVSRMYTPKDAIIGTVTNEGLPYILGIFPDPLPAPALDAFLKTIDPSLSIDSFSPFYEISNPADTRDVLSQITTDYVFNCVSQDVGEMIRQRSKRTYYYVFDEIFPADVWGAGNPCNSAVCHGIDLVSTFGTYALGGYKLSADQQKLSQDIILYWTNFAKNRTPNSRSGSLSTWFPSKSRIFSRFSFTRQLLLKAGETRITSFPERVLNDWKCATLKRVLQFRPF